jgi:pilus assembly protein CpaE
LERVVAQRRELLSAAQHWLTTVSTSQLISFYSPKGGVGKTTLALNLAATLARKHPGAVLLVDLSLPYNHAAMLAQLAPTSSLARLADVESDFEQRLVSALAYHRGGFLLLSSALSPEESDLITPELVARALAVLQSQFRFVLIDLGIALTEIALSLLEQSKDVLVVASPELLIVKDLISLYKVLRDVLKLHEGQIHLVINHRPKTVTVRGREMEKLLGVSVALEIQHDGKRPEEAAVRGEILALSASRSPIAKAAETLARMIMPNQSSK